jgi:hypothetical protein
MAMPSFLKKDENGSLLFTGKDKELLFYVPEKYFERNIAEQAGEYINLLGVFDYTIQDLKTGKDQPIKSFRLPTLFSTRPYLTEKVKQIKLIKESDPTDYRILRYREGDIVIVSTKLVQFIGNVEKFNNLFFILGYIINTIPYGDLYEYIMDAMALNGYSYGLNAQVFGVVLSEICRAKDDPNIPFRLSKSSNMHAYQSMSVKGVSKLISPYTALLSEDFDESIMYAMMNDDPKDSSLERVLIGGKTPVKDNQ